MWVMDSVVSALMDQQQALCACFRPDEAGAVVYLEVMVTADGVAHTRSLGHGELKEEEAQCWVDRVHLSTTNWLQLKPGWYAKPGLSDQGPVNHQWAGLVCLPGSEEEPFGDPQISQEWLTVNPEGVVYPAELPEAACFDMLRRNVRITFPVELRKKKEDGKNRFDKARPRSLRDGLD